METELEYVYVCRENDNIIRVSIVDGVIEEYLFSLCTDTERIVVGAEDLKKAGELAKRFYEGALLKDQIKKMG